MQLLQVFLALPALVIGLSDTKKEEIILDAFNDSDELYRIVESYTAGPHLAGKNHSLAEYTSSLWAGYGFDTKIIPYDTFLDYPVHQALSLTYTNGTVHTANLEEDPLPEDPTTGSPDRIPTFHGYSWNGNVSAEYIYVGYGRQTDFATLKARGVELEGKIALVRYGGPMRGLKVRNAQAVGMVGAVLFSDPGDDGNITVANGYEAYPAGPARNPSSVQRGSVLDFSKLGGDPTTPGYPSKPGVERQDTSDFTPRIPSLPLSYREVLPFLQALDGSGLSSEEVGIAGWKGGLDAEYSTGPVEGLEIRIENFLEDTITPMWDVIGVWNGTSDEAVVIGNHRDAWIVGGVADPNGGSGLMVQLAKGFDTLRKAGWTPQRTIVLASWDGEEYGLVGSTEFVEEYVPWITSKVVAYINLDLAVSGPILSLRGDPTLSSIVNTSLQKVASPAGGSMYEHWDKNLAVFGAQSDYAGFIHQAGVAAVDLDYTNGPTDPVYHYHSDYDSMHWMQTYGDPEWKYHKAMGQFTGLLALAFADAELLPINVTAYAESLAQFYTTLQSVISTSGVQLDTSKLGNAITAFSAAAVRLMDYAASADSPAEILAINEKLKDFSRPLVQQGGYPERPFYKHVVYGPGFDTGYLGVTFPAITEAVQAGNTSLASEWVGKTARGINEAAAVFSI